MKTYLLTLLCFAAGSLVNAEDKNTLQLQSSAAPFLFKA